MKLIDGWRHYVQTLVVKSDQEVSIVDVKNSLTRELRAEESPVGASAANAAGDAEHHESNCCAR